VKFGHLAHRRVAVSGEAVEVFLAQADLGSRLRSYLSPKAAYPGSGWIVESEKEGTIAGRNVTERILRKGASRLLVVHWFEGSPGVWREALRGLLSLDASPVARSTVPVVVRLSTPLQGAKPRLVDISRERLTRIAEAFAPGMNELVSPRG
jgi:hypothetical protein